MFINLSRLKNTIGEILMISCISVVLGHEANSSPLHVVWAILSYGTKFAFLLASTLLKSRNEFISPNISAWNYNKKAVRIDMRDFTFSYKFGSAISSSKKKHFMYKMLEASQKWNVLNRACEVWIGSIQLYIFESLWRLFPILLITGDQIRVTVMLVISWCW